MPDMATFKRIIIAGLLAVVALSAGAGSAARASEYAPLTLTEYGRNITRGQSSEYRSVVGHGGDTIEIIAHIVNISGAPLSNVFVTNLLPAGLGYIARSTAVDGRIVRDSITSSGLNIGTVYPGQRVVVRFAAAIAPHAVPVWGQIELSDNAWVRADNAAAAAVRLPITLGGQASLAAISRIKTGPIDSILLALLASIVTTGLYAMYTNTELFEKRFARARLGRQIGRDLNFVR